MYTICYFRGVVKLALHITRYFTSALGYKKVGDPCPKYSNSHACITQFIFSLRDGQFF